MDHGKPRLVDQSVAPTAISGFQLRDMVPKQLIVGCLDSLPCPLVVVAVDEDIVGLDDGGGKYKTGKEDVSVIRRGPHWNESPSRDGPVLTVLEQKPWRTPALQA